MRLAWPAPTMTQRSARPPASTRIAGMIVCGMRCASCNAWRTRGVTMPTVMTPTQNRYRVRSAHQDVDRGNLGRRTLTTVPMIEEANQDQLRQQEDLVRANQRMSRVSGPRRFSAERLDERPNRAAEESSGCRISGQQTGYKVNDGRGGRQPRDEKQWTKDRTVPQRAGDHRRQKNACVDAQTGAEENVRPAENLRAHACSRSTRRTSRFTTGTRSPIQGHD